MKSARQKMSDSILKNMNPKVMDDLTSVIISDVVKKRHAERVSKDAVLHHLKQLKAQMGKQINRHIEDEFHLGNNNGVESCMRIIDKKIAKINAIK